MDHLSNETLNSNKNEQTTTISNITDESHKYFIKETRYSKEYIYHYLICIKIKNQLAQWIYSNRSQYTYSSMRHKGASMNFDIIFHNLNIGDTDVFILKNVPPWKLMIHSLFYCMLKLHRLVGIKEDVSCEFLDECLWTTYWTIVWW